MEFLRNCILFTVVIHIVIINLQLQLASAAIGANYGMQGDNLPPPAAVIAQYQNENIPLLRLLEPNPDVLNTLRGTVIRVSLGVKNEDVTEIAMNINSALRWVTSNVVPYINEVDIGWITVGNEMVPGPAANLISQAMNNILSGLYTSGITKIKVSTVVSADVLGVTSPPSAATFSSKSSDIMQFIAVWLAGTNNPLFINVYPYYAFASNPYKIPLDYALFKAKQPVVDGLWKYYSLFEATIDAFYAALDKVGGGNITLVVAETGWPTAGNEPYTNKQNAQRYNQNLIDKLRDSGTPRKPSNILDIFIFSMYNEDSKPSGVEQNWGFHYANKDPVYHLNFTSQNI